jgi:hypothetical protein
MATAQKYACGFCKKAFRNERTLAAHMCAKKRRNLEKDTVASQHGLRLFQRFYLLNTPTKTQKTFEQFIDSKYYTSFIKLARHLMDLRPVDRDRFVDYLFQNGIKDRDWCKDKTYEAYIIDLLAKEPAQRGLERSIETMAAWGEKNDIPFNEFFENVAPAEATHMIRMGKLSPWVLYLAKTSSALWDRLSTEQGHIIAKVIDADVWFAKFELKRDDKIFVQEMLDEAGL